MSKNLLLILLLNLCVVPVLSQKDITEPDYAFVLDDNRSNNSIYKDSSSFRESDYEIKDEQHKNKYLKFITPAVLISYGVATRFSDGLQQWEYDISECADKHIKNRTHVDDILAALPSAAVFGLDWIGVKAKNDFWDRTIVMAASKLIMGGIVYSTKSFTDVTRPDGSTDDSFPSMHTAFAFTGAHILFREYRDVSPWIGIGGYATAAATGIMRVTNRRHWFSDVITGAGVGILSVELGYLLLPVFHDVFRKKNSGRNISFVPIIDKNNFVGMGMSCVF